MSPQHENSSDLRSSILINEQWTYHIEWERKTIVFICQDFPFFDRTGHFTRLERILKILKKFEFDITIFSLNSTDKSKRFFAVTEDEWTKYTSNLMKMGIRFFEFESIRDYFLVNNFNIKAVWLYGQNPGLQFLRIFKGLVPLNYIILDTIDLEYRRAQQFGEIEESLRLKNELVSLASYCDETLFISETEQKMCHADSDFENALSATSVLSNIYPEVDKMKYFQINKIYDGIFVGTFFHRPNRDAVEWFLDSIVPLLDHGKFLIIGDGLPLKIQKTIDAINISEKKIEIKYLGFVKELDEIYALCKFALAPLRIGAGVKGKVIEALNFGIPVIGTSIAFEGIGEHDGEVLFCGDDERSFAKHIAHLVGAGTSMDQTHRNIKLANLTKPFLESTATWQIAKLLNV